MIAAEPKLADDCYQSFHAGKRLPLPKYPDTIADGLKINMGPVAWPIIADLVDDVCVVTEEEIKVHQFNSFVMIPMYIHYSHFS